MLVLFLLTLWLDGKQEIMVKTVPTMEVCELYVKETAKLARKKNLDVSTNCIVIRRPNGI